MADVTLRKVVKRYDEVEAVRGIDLDIADHEFVVLVGPSGCGKSTTLRMIAGLEDISDGDIMIGYFASIPKELDEAAIIDGASWFQTLTRIFIPVALPGLIAATIRSVVLLPQPDGPTSTTSSPSATSRSTPWTATTSRPPC